MWDCQSLPINDTQQQADKHWPGLAQTSDKRVTAIFP